MTVDDAYKFIQFLARKNQIGSITPTEFASSFNSAQRAWFDTLLGKITIAPHIALGQNQRIAERLKPFKTTDEQISVTSQIVDYPEGFQAITSMSNVATGKNVVYLDDAKLKERLTSYIDPIAEANPAVYTNTSSGWKVWPATVSSVLVSYYKLPEDIVWGYSLDSNNRPVYDSDTSTDPRWDNVSIEEILGRTCTLLGISFQSQNLVQYGEMVKAQGV